MTNLEAKEREIIKKIQQKSIDNERLKHEDAGYDATLQALKSRIAELESTFNGDASHDKKIASDIAVLERKQDNVIQESTNNKRLRSKILADIEQLQNELDELYQAIKNGATEAA